MKTLTQFYNFQSWKSAAKKHGMTVRNVGPMAGANEPVDTWYADHNNEDYGGVFHKK
jgi:hypothetical protein